MAHPPRWCWAWWVGLWAGMDRGGVLAFTGPCPAMVEPADSPSPRSFQSSSTSSTNFLTVPSTTFSSTRPNDWKRLCPSPWSSWEEGGWWWNPTPVLPKDVVIVWTYGEEEDVTDVATRLLHRLRGVGSEEDNDDDESSPPPLAAPNDMEDDQHLIQTLAQSMTLFQEFCMEHLTLPPLQLPQHDDEDCQCRQDPHLAGSGGEKGGTTTTVQFKARLVTTIGSQGTKCPLWHMDHVPVRWIQTMVGPGCQWVVGDEGVNWSILQHENEKEEEEYVTRSVNDRNRALVQDDRANIYAAKEQEAVLLLGNQWPKNAKKHILDEDFDHGMENFQPVLHKSPTIPWGVHRVLFTQDVLLPHHQHLQGDA